MGENVGDRKSFIDKSRENPWMFSTLVLGLLFVGSLFFGFNSVGVTGNVVAEDVVEGKVIGFLNSQIQDGVVTLSSIERKDSFYELVVDFEGDLIPLQSTLDGEFIFTDLIPTGLGALPPLSPDGNVAGATGQGVAVDVEIGNSPVKGDINAPVSIVEFSDYQCPFCGRFFAETYPLIVKNYVDTGKVNMVFKDFPLSFHAEAQKAAEAARCFREQGDYYEYHDVLFENQESLSVENYVVWAGDLGADKKVFEICLNSGRFAAAVQGDLVYGSSLGVTGTPGFLVNGKLVSGAQPYSVFEQLIESELAGL